MFKTTTFQVNTPIVSLEPIFSQQHLSSTSSVESITQGIASLSLSKQKPPETQLLDLNNGICIKHVVSYLSCKERSRLGSLCKVLNGICKSSYKDWAQTMYEANRETELLGRVGIQVPSSLTDAIEHSELFFKNVKVRLEEINKTLPPTIKYKGSILNLLLNQTKTVDFLETLYQYSLVQVFRKNVGVADTMPLKQQAEHVLAWLNTPEQVESVTSLHLDGKKLFCIPREIGKLMNLTRLDVSENRLTSLPSEIGALTNLTDFCMSQNCLTSLPPEIGALINLNELFVSGNRLTSIPPEIGALTNLTKLRLNANQFMSLPREIGKLTNLTSLGVSGNRLTSLPQEIGALMNLTELRLDANQFTSLPPVIGKLTNLTSLSVFGNLLTSLPQEIGALMNLTELWLSANQFTSLPPVIGKLTNLTSLSVFGNLLTSLPQEIGALMNLTELSMYENQFTSLPPEIGNLPNLTDLWLDQTTADKSLSEIETMKRRGVRVILD